jgi:RNA recognition motif-containing protein
MKLFVGNFAFSTTEDELRSAFEPFGQVDSVSIVRERSTNESRGFAFVSMPTDSEAQAAMNELNGKEFAGRNLNINEARPLAPRPPMRGGFSSNRPDARRPDARRRDSGRRKPGGGSRKGGKPKFGRSSY